MSATADSIVNIAVENTRSNADIQAHDLAYIPGIKMETVLTNLQILSETPVVQDQDVRAAVPLFSTARLSTNDFA